MTARNSTLRPQAALLLLLACSSGAHAESSIWYRNDDPFATEALAPPLIPQEYLDPSRGYECTPPDYSAALTLADVVNIALCNNPQTREAWASARQQAAQLGVARSAYLPSISNTTSGSLGVASPQSPTRDNPYSNISNNLVASYLLYDFGNRDANLENARQLLLAASASQNSVIQSLLLNVVQSYFQVQAGIASVEAAIESEKASEESFKAAEARYKAGVATPADKLQAQTSLAQATLARITAEGSLKTAYGNLANVMGLDASHPLTLAPRTSVNPEQNLEQDINALIEEARQRRPDLLASEAQLRAAEASIAASRAAAKPTVSLSVSNSSQNGSDISSSNTGTIGLSVSIPLFDGYGPSYRIRSAEALAEARAAQRDRLRLQISLDVWNAYQALRTAGQSVRAAEALLASAEESSRVALGRYRAGVGNILDTLNAQSALASARQQKIQADLNWNIARAALAQAMGALDHAMIQSLPAAEVSALTP
ncbi:MAG TPA: TolC family protein [Methylophilaceae bacterium]